jgi:hypothetical protein
MVLYELNVNLGLDRIDPTLETVIREIKYTGRRASTYLWGIKKTVNGKEIGHIGNPDDSAMQLTVKLPLRNNVGL